MESTGTSVAAAAAVAVAGAAPAVTMAPANTSTSDAAPNATTEAATAVENKCIYLLDSEMASTSGVQSRCKDKIFLVGYPIHQITGCKLPSNRQVLCVLFYNLRAMKLTLRESAKLAIRKVLIFWEKARIPTKNELDAVTKLQKLYAEWRALQKDRKKASETIKNKFKQFDEKLDDLFDIAKQDALALMKSEEDKAFLAKQRQKSRPGSVVGAEDIKAEKGIAKMNLQIKEETFEIDSSEKSISSKLSSFW